MMSIKVPDDKTLVITGSEGSGKTRFAIQIAESAGTWAHIGQNEIKNEFGLGHALEDAPTTIIVDECNFSDEDFLRRCKKLITSERVEVNRMYQKPYIVSTPNFIFVTRDAAPLKLEGGARRFMVVYL